MLLLEELKQYSVVLASQSQRRQELLAKLGIVFQTDIAQNEEIYPPDFMPSQIVTWLSKAKADEVMARHNNPYTIVIGGDTIVALRNHILGKPQTPLQARQMLEMLSGQKHAVWSGLCVRTNKITLSRCDVAYVWFKNLSGAEIDYYVQHFSPFDKAGGYGIQEWIGYHGITRIEGSFYTIVGFPTHTLWEMMTQIVQQDHPD